MPVWCCVTNVPGFYGRSRYRRSCAQLLYSPGVQTSQVLDAKVTSFADANCTPSTGTFRVLTVKTQCDAFVPTRGVAGVQSNCHLLCGSVYSRSLETSGHFYSSVRKSSYTSDDKVLCIIKVNYRDLGRSVGSGSVALECPSRVVVTLGWDSPYTPHTQFLLKSVPLSDWCQCLCLLGVPSPGSAPRDSVPTGLQSHSPPGLSKPSCQGPSS